MQPKAWIWAGIVNITLGGYFVFDFTSDPDSCLANDDSNVRIEIASKSGDDIDVGARF